MEVPLPAEADAASLFFNDITWRRHSSEAFPLECDWLVLETIPLNTIYIGTYSIQLLVRMVLKEEDVIFKANQLNIKLLNFLSAEI